VNLYAPPPAGHVSAGWVLLQEQRVVQWTSYVAHAERWQRDGGQVQPVFTLAPPRAPAGPFSTPWSLSTS
jgi:hypothetical protein